jgi:TetR/AcrR family transcriptional repressor of bet genes
MSPGKPTLGDVAREAGLSQGIVNLHFKSKDNLLKETLSSLASEYREKFDKALRKSGPCPADKLQAIMQHDLRPSICNQRKLAIWFAFWGEVKSRPSRPTGAFAMSGTDTTTTLLRASVRRSSTKAITRTSMR